MKASTYTITIKLYWEDLSDKAKDKLREILDLGDDDDNGWNIIPITTFGVSRTVFEENCDGTKG